MKGEIRDRHFYPEGCDYGIAVEKLGDYVEWAEEQQGRLVKLWVEAIEKDLAKEKTKEEEG